MTLQRAILAVVLLEAVLLASDSAVEVPLWQNGAPGSEGMPQKEQVLQPGRIAGIHNPSITIYLPIKDKATGAAIVIAPGGGHQFLSIDHEGYDVAKWFANEGVAGFVLKYRLARESGSKYSVDVEALQDMQRAVRLVRDRAGEWGVDPNRVGVLGFSAGGELAALASVRFDKGLPEAAGTVDRQPSRPDFEVLVYPGYPKDWQPTKETPPTMLICASDDRPSISESSAQYYLALKKAGVPVELHIYTRGGHGFGIRNRPLPVSGWPARVMDWLGDRGFLKKP